MKNEKMFTVNALINALENAKENAKSDKTNCSGYTKKFDFMENILFSVPDDIKFEYEPTPNGHPNCGVLVENVINYHLQHRDSVAKKTAGETDVKIKAIDENGIEHTLSFEIKSGYNGKWMPTAIGKNVARVLFLNGCGLFVVERKEFKQYTKNGRLPYNQPVGVDAREYVLQDKKWTVDFSEIFTKLYNDIGVWE